MKLTEAVRLFDESLRGEGLSPRTVQGYRQRLAVLVDGLGGDEEVERVTPEQLRRWRAKLMERQTRYAAHPGRPTEEGGLSPHTLRSYVQAVRAFFTWLHAEDYLTNNPAARLRLPKLPEAAPKAVSEDDLKRLLAEAERSGPRDYALLRFLGDTGCRVGGLCNLKVDDVDLQKRRALVSEKGNRTRTVYFRHETATALATWLAERPTTQHNHVFTGRRGPLKPSGVYQVLRRLAKRARIAGRFNPHAFRHATARRLLQNCADLGTVAQLLGHRDVRVTSDFYARWTPDELADRYERFSADEP